VKHLSVPVSEELDETIRKRMAEGGFGSMAEYLRHAVRQELEHADQAKLERLLLEGLESGAPIEATAEWIAERKAKLRKLVKGRSSNERPE
jgi:antitoxin ParD1/3/4